MKHIKSALIVIIMVAVLIVGLWAAQNINFDYISQSSQNSQAAGSVVYVQNGVSGVLSISDPYLNKTSEITVEYSPLDSGSGFVVNSEGYIVTAFHVVGDPESAINQDVLRLMNSNDIQLYLERAAVNGYVSKYNPQLASELISNVTYASPVLQTTPDLNTTTDLLKQRNLIQVKSAKQQIKVKLPGSSNGDSINADLIDVGDAVTSQDVALIKIDTLFKKLNPLTLNSNNPLINTDVLIYGYPVRTEGMYSSNNQSVIQPSSSSGFVTSYLPDHGTDYYVTTAMAQHGFSGGPVVDSNNSVLGILIFSLVSNNSRQNQSSVFLSSNYIIQLCQKNNISINVV